MAKQDLRSHGTRVHPFAEVNGDKKRWAKVRVGERHSAPEKDVSVITIDSVTQDSLTSCPAALTADDLMQQAEKPGVMEFQEGRDISIDMADPAYSLSLQSNGQHAMQDERVYMQYAMSAPIRKLDHPADKSVMLSFLSSLFYLLAVLIVFVPIMCLLLIIFPIGWLVKHLMACCCCCAPRRVCSCCCSRMLSPTDEMWLHDDKLNKLVLHSLITLEHGLDLMRLRDLINARLLCAEEKNGRKTYPRFTQKIIPLKSGFAWEDDENFHIEDHIYAMPDSIQTEAELKRYVAAQATIPMSIDKPLWEMQVLNNYGEAQDTVILVRNHPVLTDGISLAQILLKNVVDNAAICQMKQRYSRSVYIFNAIRAIVVGPLVFLHKWIFTRQDYNILHGPPLSGRKVVSWSQPFSFAVADRIKKVTRTTLNDVLTSVVAGNLRTYFQRRGVNNPYNLLAVIPIDFRTEPIRVRLGTDMCFNSIILPTNVEGAIPRLWQMKQEMDEAKNSADAVVMYGAQWVLSNCLPLCWALPLWWSVWGKASLLLSNIPGPDTVLLFGSREIKSIMYMMPTPCNVALAISFMTYADQIRMTVIADENVITNPTILTQDFIYQMEKLATLLAHRRIPGEHRGAASRMEAVLHDHMAHREPSLEQLQQKMSEVQQQLQELKSHLDGEQVDREEERKLVDKVESLKEEFRELLAELRRKRMSQGGTVLSDDEDEDDGELRRSSYRKRTMSMSSRRSTLSNISTARPLATSSQSYSVHSPPHSSVHSPSSPSLAVSGGSQQHGRRAYHTVHHAPTPRQHVHALQFSSQATDSQDRVSEHDTQTLQSDHSQSLPSLFPSELQSNTGKLEASPDQNPASEADEQVVVLENLSEPHSNYSPPVERKS